MTWALLEHRAVLACGSYADLIALAASWEVLTRSWHPDGTELAPRWNVRGWALLPAEMVSQGAAS